MNKNTRWRLAELQSKAEQILTEATQEEPEEGPVRIILNERTLRYYTTIGLMDPPAEIRGRTGYYNRHHLLQIVAIKRLQQEGLSLDDIKNKLIGQPDSVIAAIAELPEASDEDDYYPTGPCESEDMMIYQEATPYGDDHLKANRSSHSPDSACMRSLALDEIVVAWKGSSPDDQDSMALKKAAEPLIRELKKRNLIP